jgi:hypothetical protein
LKDLNSLGLVITKGWNETSTHVAGIRVGGNNKWLELLKRSVGAEAPN